MPYAFNKFDCHGPLLSKSTCSEENSQWSYDLVHELHYDVQPFTCSNLSDIQFHKLEKLTIRSPPTNYFCSMVPTLKYLTSLKIVISNVDEEYKSQLERLLSQASSIRSISFDFTKQYNLIDSLPLHIEKSSLKRIKLAWIGYYTQEQCAIISHSSLFMHCEELEITLAEPSSVAYLIETMPCPILLYVRSCRRFDAIDCLQQSMVNNMKSVKIHKKDGGYDSVIIEP